MIRHNVCGGGQSLSESGQSSAAALRFNFIRQRIFAGMDIATI